MQYPLVGVIIVNWNQKELTDKCLQSIKKNTYPAVKIILVDNASSDGSIEYIRQRHPEIKCLLNQENLGFTGGNNIGIGHALSEGCDYVYLLNNDTEIDPDFLNAVISAAESDRKIGIAGSTVFYFDSRDTVWYTGGHANWVSGDMIDPYAGKRIGIRLPRLQDVDEVAGAGMLVRRKVIEEVGLLDERFFIYYEETDWCQRAKKAGWRVVWAPESKVWHKVSMAFGELSPVMIYLMTRNRWLFMRKHCPHFILFAVHYFLRSAKRFFEFWRQKQPILQRAVVLGVRDAVLGRYGKGEMEALRRASKVSAPESPFLWLSDSGVCIREISHPAYGGVHAGYNTKTRQWLFLYNEITGYAISMLCMLYLATGQQRYLEEARASASFLLNRQISESNAAAAGSFPEGLNFPDLSPMSRCYSFDAAMCIQGLLDLYHITGEAALEKAAKDAGNWLLSMQDQSGFFFSYYDAQTGSRTHPGLFFHQDAGCLHAKHAIALLKLHAVSGDPRYQAAAQKVCDWVLSLQDNDGAFWANPERAYVYAHAHCYATEGLLFAFEKLKIPAYGSAIERACDWLDAHIDKRYGIVDAHKIKKGSVLSGPRRPGRLFRILRSVFPRTEIATDATIQSARLFLYRYLLADSLPGLEKAKSIMRTLIPKVLYRGKDISARGGLYSRLDVSFGPARPSPVIATWAGLFWLSTYLTLDAVTSGKKSIIGIDRLF